MYINILTHFGNHIISISRFKDIQLNYLTYYFYTHIRMLVYHRILLHGGYNTIVENIHILLYKVGCLKKF